MKNETKASSVALYVCISRRALQEIFTVTGGIESWAKVSSMLFMVVILFLFLLAPTLKMARDVLANGQIPSWIFFVMFVEAFGLYVFMDKFVFIHQREADVAFDRLTLAKKAYLFVFVIVLVIVSLVAYHYVLAWLAPH